MNFRQGMDKESVTMTQTNLPDGGAGTWPAGIAAVTLFVEDLETTKQFYQKVFGLPVHFEEGDSAVFKFGNTLINLLRITQANELIEPARVAVARRRRAVCLHAHGG